MQVARWGACAGGVHRGRLMRQRSARGAPSLTARLTLPVPVRLPVSGFAGGADHQTTKYNFRVCEWASIRPRAATQPQNGTSGARNLKLVRSPLAHETDQFKRRQRCLNTKRQQLRQWRSNLPS